MYSKDYNIAKMKRERTEKTGDRREKREKRKGKGHRDAWNKRGEVG